MFLKCLAQGRIPLPRSAASFPSTFCVPLGAGIPTHTLINTTDLQYPGRVHKLDLLNLRGDTITEAPVLYDPRRPWLYNVSQFLPPDGWFYLKVGTLQDSSSR